MGTDEKNIQDKKSFWARIGGLITTGLKVVVYPVQPRSWFKSWGEIWHDIQNGGRYMVGSPHKEWVSPIEIEPDSKDLGIEVIEQKEERVKFVVSRTLIGDITQMSDEQLGKVRALNSKYLNIAIDRNANKVVVEIDVEKIINDIKADPENEGKSAEEIKRLAIGKIIEQVDGSLKGVAKITGGEFKHYADSKLLKGIGEKLYQEYGSQKQQQGASEAVIPKSGKQLGGACESVMPTTDDEKLQASFSLSNPKLFPFHNGQGNEITSSFDRQEARQLREIGDILKKANISNVESSETVKPLSTPKEEEKGGRGY